MANRDVFVDTSGLYALIDKRDANHLAARGTVERLVRTGPKLVLTDYVVAEAATLARVRSGAHLASRLLDLLEKSVGIRLEWIGPERFEATKRFFRKHGDHDYSFIDCSSFVVMRELRLTAALTSDGHFFEAGFQSLLPAGDHR